MQNHSLGTHYLEGRELGGVPADRDRVPDDVRRSVARNSGRAVRGQPDRREAIDTPPAARERPA
jgi:hypothetical protein